jgi:hypothetical protein
MVILLSRQDPQYRTRERKPFQQLIMLQDLLDRRPLGLGAAVLAFVVLGCVFRIIRYGQNLPLWSDECFLGVNFIRRGFVQLLGPLDNGQIAPLLFLWTQRLAIDLLGFSEWSLRIFPLCCGLASMLLFWHLALRVHVADPVAYVLAVGIFAVSVHPIRHAAEAKPYATDLLVAVALLVPVAAWLRAPGQVRWLLGLAALVPVALGFSNPAIFVASGVCAGLVGPAWHSGERRQRLACVAVAAAILAGFVGFHLLLGRAQSHDAIAGLRQYWAASFPPLANPLRLVAWLADAHTGSAFAYPGGGSRGLSTATTLAMVLGAAVMIRGGQKTIVACLLAPLGLGLLAAALRLYPYGSEARLMQYAAPAICLLAGRGGAVALGCVPKVELRGKLLAGCMVGLVLCGAVPQVVSWVIPYRMSYDHEARQFARRFWPEQANGAVLRCVDLDFGVLPQNGWQGRKAWYLCNQMIYSPARRRSYRIDDREITAEHPLRCVLFNESEHHPAVREWLGRMSTIVRPSQVTVFEVPVTVGGGKPVIETWRMFEFVPRGDSPIPAVACSAEGRARL